MLELSAFPLSDFLFCILRNLVVSSIFCCKNIFLCYTKLNRTFFEALIGTKVNLELFVKVRKDWKNDALALSDLGFNKKDN